MNGHDETTFGYLVALYRAADELAASTDVDAVTLSIDHLAEADPKHPMLPALREKLEQLGRSSERRTPAFSRSAPRTLH